MEASKSQMRSVKMQTQRSDMSVFTQMPFGSFVFCWLLLPVHGMVLGESRHVHVTFSRLKQWKRHSIDHCYEDSDGKQLWDAWTKCGRCANISSSRPATQSPGLGRHQPKCFYSPSLLCSEVKTLILLPWLPLPLPPHTNSVSGRKQNAFKKERAKGR